MKKKYNTGLVLSGGGTRGFAHLGVIAALKEKGIQPDVICGTSVGAIVGAFTAAGKSPDEVMKIFKKGGFFKYTKLHIPTDGLMKLTGLQEVIQKEITYKNIEELPLPFWLAVSNLNKGIVEYKNSGSLDQLVLASSSIPVLFAPVEVNGQTYVDGGLMDNMPVEPVKNDCEHIITVNISPINPHGKFTNLVQIALRTFYMSVNVNTGNVKKQSTLYLEPRGIDTYDLLSLSRADELFELGYQALKDKKIPF